MIDGFTFMRASASTEVGNGCAISQIERMFWYNLGSTFLSLSVSLSLSLSVCLSRLSVSLPPGADHHCKAGAGAASAVVRRGLRGGEVGGAGTRRGATRPEHGQHGLLHVPVHQVNTTCTSSQAPPHLLILRLCSFIRSPL